MQIEEVSVRRAKNGVVITKITNEVVPATEDVLVVNPSHGYYDTLFAADLGRAVVDILYGKTEDE